MKLTTTAILLSLVAAAFLFPSASAIPQPYACSDLVNPSCGHDVCFAPSYTQAPRCADVPLTSTTTLGFCTEGHSPCPFGKLVCVTDNGKVVACVPDPCATTACFASPACTGCGLVSVCVEGVNAASCFGGHDVCVAFSTQVPFCADVPCSDGSCFTVSPNVGYCVEGTPPCYTGDLVCVTSHGQAVACVADPCATTECFPPQDSSVQCFERYWRADVGPVSVVSTDSCHYEAYYDGQPILS